GAAYTSLITTPCTPAAYHLSLHDALPIFTMTANLKVPVLVGVPLMTPLDAFSVRPSGSEPDAIDHVRGLVPPVAWTSSEYGRPRSEEHTSELQSQSNLVCRLLLEKKNAEY